MAGVPAIVSRRVDNPESSFSAGLRYRRFARVIAISETIADVLRNSGLDEERLRVIRSSVDLASVNDAPDRQRFRQEFGIPDDALVLAAIGQLIPRKGHRLLLEALAELPGDSPAYRLLILGQGPLEDELKALTKSLGLEDSVRLAGFRDDLDEWLGAIDIVVHPAEAEGLGVALLKAAAAACAGGRICGRRSSRGCRQWRNRHSR